MRDPKTSRIVLVGTMMKGRDLVDDVHIISCNRNGQRGRVATIRIHPLEGPSNPAIQVTRSAWINIVLH